jgi:hypothetical protein
MSRALPGGRVDGDENECGDVQHDDDAQEPPAHRVLDSFGPREEHEDHATDERRGEDVGKQAEEAERPADAGRLVDDRIAVAGCHRSGQGRSGWQ